MPRPSQLLYTPRTPATPRDSATLLLLRDGSGGLDVLMTRRTRNASFAADMFVFPGGVIDAGDAALLAQATTRDTQDAAQAQAAAAALRETFEELGILLARDASGNPVSAAQLAALDRGAPLAAQCQARGLRLAVDALHPLCRWITGHSRPKRYDTLFFVAQMPGGQEPVADDAEQFEPTWVSPAQALAAHEAGRFSMMFPTIRTLEYLQRYPDAAAVLATCQREQPLWSCCSRGGLVGGREQRFMDHEPPYGELALTSPDGQTRHSLDWQHEAPVPLLKNVQRLTAPNPGMMTGPGTNSYIVGDAQTGHIVIDPGPNDAAHIRRLHDASDGDIRAIVCTHSHPDHFPGARPLQALCANRPPILGLSSAPTARPDSRFTPDRALADGERLVLASTDGALQHTLRIIHTPGHAANHLCLLLEEDGLLFSGDHILNGSTTVIAPPDGHMGDYLASLDKLDAACAETGAKFILPAHGYVLGRAREVIAWYRQHRLQREAKVLAAMQERPDGDLDDWLPLVYGDVPERVWPVARRSLLAHVEHIRENRAHELR
ncbi:MAG: MBL fold metallo-hydrolase [Ottowia sp.]|nr:MBL fold metallo-hydrolase [Ottowia sp.]